MKGLPKAASWYQRTKAANGVAPRASHGSLPPPHQRAGGHRHHGGDEGHGVLGRHRRAQQRAHGHQPPRRRAPGGRRVDRGDQAPGREGEEGAQDVGVELPRERQQQGAERQPEGGQVGRPRGDPPGRARHQHQQPDRGQERRPERHPPHGEVALGPVDLGRLHPDGPAHGVDRGGEEGLERRLVGVHVALVLDPVDEHRRRVRVDAEAAVLDQRRRLGDAHRGLGRHDRHQRAHHHDQQQRRGPQGRRQGLRQATGRHVRPSAPAGPT